MAHQMDLDTIAAYWNSRAAEFDSEHDTEDLALWSRTLEQAIGLNGAGSVLDVGTGTGFLALLLAKLGYTVSGVDIAADMLAQGVEKAKCFGLNVDFREAACERLPFADETFDAVVNCRVMWTLTAPEEAAREWKRVLKPGGKVISFMRMMDMTGGYRRLMKELFPWATIIVDKYHYVRQITYALERVRVEEQKRLSDRWRKYFKRSKYILLKDTRKLTMDDRIQLENILRISEPLRKAYELKQQFELVKASKDREEAARRLSKWIFRAQQSGLPDFIKVSFTYQNWSKEILNSFEFPYTNGYIEGCNNRIKVLKRVSFGMPRFARFRRRIMHIMLN